MSQYKGIAKIDETLIDKLKKGVNYLLGIGINEYSNFPKLYNARKDIEDITNLLISEYYFEKNNILSLFDEEATRENIIEEISALRSKIKQEDRIIIYYSGHGYMDGELGFWIPTDAKRDRISTYVSNSDIQSLIKSINAKHILLISDSCFSASLLVRDISSKLNKARLYKHTKKIPRIFVL